MEVLKDLIMDCVACKERYVVSSGYQLELHRRIERLQLKDPSVVYQLPKRCPACREIKRIKYDQKKKLYELRQNNKNGSSPTNVRPAK